MVDDEGEGDNLTSTWKGERRKRETRNMQHMGKHEAMKRSGDRGGRWDLSADQAKEKRLLVSSLYSLG